MGSRSNPLDTGIGSARGMGVGAARRCLRRASAALALPLSATLILAATACGSTSSAASGSERSGSVQPSSVSALSSSVSRSSEARAKNTPIRVIIGKTILTARLWDNATARSLIARLPLTLSFGGFSGQEKNAHLRRPLSMRGMPTSADPRPREIGYYAPTRDLVFYYGDVGRFAGIARIGRFDGGIAAITNRTGNFSARIELAR